MIEAKLLVGRFLEFIPTASRPLPSGAHVPAFIDVVCPPKHIKESSRNDYNPFHSNLRKSGVGDGAKTNPAKVHRNFKWLPWYAGDISTTTLDCDVLTGPMSGCMLVAFNDAVAGVRKVGHIGTVTVTDAVPATVNTNVKAVWNNFANNHPLDVVGGFNPVANTVPAHGPALPGDSAGQTWGLYTVSGNFYAVNVWVQVGTANKYRIAGVHLCPNVGLHALQNL